MVILRDIEVEPIEWEIVDGKGESLQFFEFMDNLRDIEVEPIEGEIVDGEGI